MRTIKGRTGYGRKLKDKPHEREFFIGGHAVVYMKPNEEAGQYTTIERQGIHEGWTVYNGSIYLVLKPQKTSVIRLIPLTRLTTSSIRKLGGVAPGAYAELKEMQKMEEAA